MSYLKESKFVPACSERSPLSSSGGEGRGEEAVFRSWILEFEVSLVLGA
jgi:hypothetical protein